MNNIAAHSVGVLGELVARRYLRAKGYKILQTNTRFRYGEIDLVARISRQIWLIEVKSRLGTKFGYPEEMVNPRKIRKLIDLMACVRGAYHTSYIYRLGVVCVQFSRKDDGRLRASVRFYDRV